jgi:hypothetical protein
MRKGPLSNKDKEFISDNLNMSASKLAAELDRSEKAVEQYRSEIKEESETLAMQQFGRNKKYGVVVMTENASMLSDETKNKPKSLEQIRKYRGAIHTIRKD